MLSTVFDVSHDMVEAATKFTNKELNIRLPPSCTAPLAVGLYEEKSGQLVEESTNARAWNVGVIVQTGYLDVGASDDSCFETANNLGSEGPHIAPQAPLLNAGVSS